MPSSGAGPIPEGNHAIAAPNDILIAEEPCTGAQTIPIGQVFDHLQTAGSSRLGGTAIDTSRAGGYEDRFWG